ncbi:MAG: hypothetical protein JRI66_12220 [Deltaproteobacteria bacterium]|nr:hypothetical protein [Deltaproteobacteria bacterium]
MRRDRAFVEQEVNLYSASAKNLLSLIPSVSIALHKINFRRPDSQGRELQRVIDEEIIKPLAADLEAATACSIDDYQACCGECEVVYLPRFLKKDHQNLLSGSTVFSAINLRFRQTDVLGKQALVDRPH